MILASRRQDWDVRPPVSSSAIAPHRGDVTTVMAAAAVRRRAERHGEDARDRDPPRAMLDALRGATARR